MPSPQEEDLLEKLAAHPSFKKSPAGVRLLRELYASRDGSTAEQLTARLFPDAEPGKAAGRFRTLLYRVRTAIDEIYDDPSSEFQQQPRPQIEVEGKSYLVRFSSSVARPYLSAFWRPYLICTQAERQIQTSDRFFLRLGDHLYFRDVTSPDWPDWSTLLSPLCEELNIDAGAFDPEALYDLEQELVRRLAETFSEFLSKARNAEVSPGDTGAALRKRFKPVLSRHYVSAGESVALTHIAELFQSFQKPVMFGNRAGTTTDDQTANIVQVGKPRQGTELSKILDKQRFVAGQDRIIDTTKTGEKEEDKTVEKDDPHSHIDEPKLFLRSGSKAVQPLVKYALVTRCPNARDPYVITSIVSSHGRVTEAVCEYLGNENSVASLCKEFGWNVIPARFQFVLRVNVNPGGDRERTKAEVHGIETKYAEWT